MQINLLTNAICYNREGGRVSVTLGPGNMSQLRLSVRDTGPGIPTELQSHLFHAFSPLNIHGPKQAGIGLAISRELAILMNGDLGFESEPGKGSTFWIELPPAKSSPHLISRRHQAFDA